MAAGIDTKLFDLGYLDTLASQNTPVHSLDARAKLVTTLAFVACLVSFGKYELSALLPFAVYPAALMAAGNLPVAYIARRVLLVAPFAVFVGLFNPFLDRTVLTTVGDLQVTGGMLSFASILVRFGLTASAAFILIAVTGMGPLSGAMTRLGVPRVFSSQFLLLYRYLFVLVDEGARMVRARQARSFGARGRGLASYGPLVGHLLLRAMARAERIHLAMRCRGFDGEIRSLRPPVFGRRDLLFTAGWVAAFVLFRTRNVPRLLGDAILELIR